jgi:hypothetical protein
VRRHRPHSAHCAGKSWRRVTIRLVAATIAATLAIGGWMTFQAEHTVSLTFDGNRIAHDSALLGATEHQVSQIVRQRHGAQAADSRCYFTASATQPSETGSVSIGSRVLCGPVLFVDGDRNSPYLAFDLKPGSVGSGKVQLTVSSEPEPLPSAGARPGLRLVRSDGRQAPQGTGGLVAPTPPPAVGDVLTTVSTLPSEITPAPRDAVMIGQTSGARLVEYGFIQRYGTGDEARVAPPARRLLAFAVTPLSGEAGADPPALSIRIGGVERGPLVSTSDYVVTAIPDDAQQVDLVLNDNGVKQSLSLLTGKPDPANPALAARANRMAKLNIAKNVTVRVTGATGTAGMTSGTITFGQVALTYFAPDGSHASGSDKALLHVMATVRLAGDRQAYGAECELLSVAIPGSKLMKFRNAAADQATQVDDVVEVPATVTSGAITYAGTVSTPGGSITVVTPVTVRFTIADS